MAHGSVSPDSPACVVVAEVNGALVVPGCLDPALYDWVLHPMLDEC